MQPNLFTPIDRERILYQMDRDALLAVYGHLEHDDTAQDIAEKLGGWETEHAYVLEVISTNNFGSGVVSFGVEFANGLATPWAVGPQTQDCATWPCQPGGRYNKLWPPGLDALGDVLTYGGHLVGFTPNLESVAGDVRFDIDRRTLGGVLDFTSLRYWNRDDILGANPVAPGSTPGKIWGDGDLSYRVGLNSSGRADITGFVQSGDGQDEGIVTGAIFGGKLEGFGGTLKRDDLTAAFGGRR